MYVLYCWTRRIWKRKAWYGTVKRQPETNSASSPALPNTAAKMSSVQQGTEAQRQMLRHILFESKAAQDHLQIMNRDNCGSEEVQNARGGKQKCYVSVQHPTSAASVSGALIGVLSSKDMTSTNISSTIIGTFFWSKRYGATTFHTKAFSPHPAAITKYVRGGQWSWTNMSKFVFFQIPELDRCSANSRNEAIGRWMNPGVCQTLASSCFPGCPWERGKKIGRKS